MTGSDDRYRQLLEGFPQGVVFFFEDGDPLRYTFVGGDGLDAIGLEPGDLEGRPVAEHRPSDTRDEIREQYRKALAGEDLSYEVEAEGRTFRFFLGPLLDDDGETIIGGRGIAQDVTEQTVYEAELERQNERLEHAAELLSHDLRNPLNVAQGHLALLQEELDNEHLDAIARALDRIEALTETELRLHGGEHVRRLETCGLTETVEAAWQNVATKEATLQIGGDRDIPAVESDLRRLFENLVRNSVAHGGSDVRVFVEPLPDGFALEDDGPGISPDRRDRIFERGISDVTDGIGLGLFICRRVADEHSWNMHATDGEHGGARFVVTGVGTEPTDDKTT